MHFDLSNSYVAQSKTFASASVPYRKIPAILCRANSDSLASLTSQTYILPSWKAMKVTLAPVRSAISNNTLHRWGTGDKIITGFDIAFEVIFTIN